jgi:hypothetical protein
MNAIGNLLGIAVLLGLSSYASISAAEDDPVPVIPMAAPAVEPGPVAVDPNLQRLVRAHLERIQDPAYARVDAKAEFASSPFFSKLQMVQFNFLPLADVDLINESTAIVRGRVVAVSDGRVIDYAQGTSNPLLTMVLDVAVDSVLKGDAEKLGSHVYVELIRSPVVSTQELGQVLPERPLILFLSPAHWDRERNRYRDEGKGVPEGKELFGLRTPQGMLVELNDLGDLAQPLTDEPAFKRGLTTRDQVLREIARIVGHPARTPT